MRAIVRGSGERDCGVRQIVARAEAQDWALRSVEKSTEGRWY